MGIANLNFCRILAILAVFLLVASTSALAQEKVKSDIVFSTDSVVTSGYAQAITIRNIIQPEFRKEISVFAVQNERDRLNQLLKGEADLCFCGSVGFMAQEGLSGFNNADQGPQEIRRLLSSFGEFAITFAIASRDNKTDISKLNGKRVVWLRDNDTYNLHTTALLAFGGLGWRDVQQVIFPDYQAAMEGFQRNLSDALLVLSSTPDINILKNGKRRFALASLPADNRAGWQRLKYLAPYMSPQDAAYQSSQGNDILKGATYPYPSLTVTANTNSELTYTITRAITEKFDSFAEAAKDIEGWNILFQDFFGSIPFHDGAIQYFKELNLWTEEAQQHQDMLLRRQLLLRRAFETQKNLHGDKKEFPLIWQEARDSLLAALANGQ
ncbi:TAXI family TRAP transporter solute-binding subunit [Sneathiella sp. P13V-1]|uniref:TAXI family TRAP transporter solute-binding subunit n=1 Tax=Sneathiella sp. P13V-1 TaxID=2697366 RepID=UPI00187B5598|nr:TAXI family TRAP transporter solute-binding subunit [Sneathiella sp. P13V-1]MBE7638455.1 TAXI family TRAP transporter solute-binding subunit [Sneathiella sp. P13V-1]